MDSLHMQHRLLIFLWLARPKEAIQSILIMAQHQVNVQVRDTLADPVFEGNKWVFCL
jgi:hypothetical protein